MTSEEKQSIISEILLAIRANSLTIDDLVKLDTMPSDAYIEVSGGRRISCATLKQAVASLFDASIDAERSRAIAAEEKLMLRIQGTSADSNSRLDPFKNLGPDTDEGYSSYEAFNTALNGLLFDNSVVGYNQGFFRARVRWCEVEIQNIVLSNNSSNMIIVQIVKGSIRADSTNEKITNDDSGAYRILYRQHANDAWGEWKEIGSVDLSGYVTDAELTEALKSKVDAVEGKGLSTNDFTTTLKNKLDGIASGAEVNVQSDWNATSGDAFIKNKPTFKTINGNSILGSGNIEITGGNDVDLSGYVTRDEFELMGSDTDLGFVNLANRISELKYSDINDTPTFKTINGASIIGSGNIDLSGYVTDEELATTKAGLETKIDFQDQQLTELIEELGKSAIRTIQINGSSFASDPEDDGFVLLPFKTINGQSIVKSGSDDSENIEITGGDGSVDLSDYVTRDEFDTLNTSAVKAIQINGNAYIPDEDGFVNLGNITDGGIASESDPLFTASPAATITEENIKQWNAKADASAIPTKLSQLTDDVGYLTGAATDEQVDGVEQAEGSSINYDLNIKAVNHRGYSYEAPENTIPAYILSKKKGFTYVGGDISFTKDSVAVLLHDATIDRTSNGSGDITALNYQEVLQYDFGSWFSPEYAGVRIATFKEWIMLCKNLGLHPYIELKSAGEYTQAQITQVVGEVEECGMRGKVTYISFSDTYLGYVKNADASARLGLLANPLNSSKISQAKALKTTTNEVFLDAELSTVTDALISTLIINDQPLEVWTVNTEEEILNMPSYVSGVTSDHIIAGKVLYKNALTYVPPVSTWIPTTAITLDKSSLAISTLEPITLVATVEPSNSNEPVVWTSSNPSVATVDNGVVTPIAEGSCTITATSGSHSASCSLAVTLVSYNITRNLQGCELSNTIDKIVTGNVYEANVLPNEGYGIKDAVVSITMGGVDITSTAYSNGVISISEVTGDVIINVRCAEAAEMNEMTLDVSRLDEAVLI